MADDSNRMSDAVTVDLNPDVSEETGEPQPQLRRPADSASKADWVDYVVALGASRDHVEGTSEHYDADRDEYLAVDALTREQLAELADRLGG